GSASHQREPRRSRPLAAARPGPAAAAARARPGAARGGGGGGGGGGRAGGGGGGAASGPAAGGGGGGGGGAGDWATASPGIVPGMTMATTNSAARRRLALMGSPRGLIRGLSPTC